MHQDIAPRNLLVDPKTDNLLLFDFDRAARIGQPSCFPERNDVKVVVFTLYEIYPETTISGVEHREQDQNSVQHRKDLDAAPAAQDVEFKPDIPDVPPASPVIGYHDENGEFKWGDSFIHRRRQTLKSSENVIMWERPPQQLAPLG
ncbi:hypothetical protein V496_10032 [Pseudogymnoascus sp. VKM F-4515 (FW-2607)]|nr:hypothetical protein V496_10032 [Pseudogymnoascus sp. VKM F-4515 (FW-2607)]